MKKGSFIRRMKETVGSDENLPWQPLVEICGQNRLLIEHHKGVVEYSREQIGVAVKFGQIIVAGEQLRLCQISAGQLVITGSIRCVTLQGG